VKRWHITLKAGRRVAKANTNIDFQIICASLLFVTGGKRILGRSINQPMDLFRLGSRELLTGDSCR